MVTSPGSPSPPTAHPPPPVPQDPEISNILTNYLNQFSLWCRRGFAAKLNAQTALPGIMLQANNAPPGVVPNVFMLQVNQAGSFIGVQVPLGGGQASLE